MRILNITLLLIGVLQSPNIAFARYCDDPDKKPPPRCHCSGFQLVCPKPSAIIPLGLAPHCSPENKKRYCNIDCTVYDSDNKAYLDIQCMDSCLSAVCN